MTEDASGSPPEASELSDPSRLTSLNRRQAGRCLRNFSNSLIADLQGSDSYRNPATGELRHGVLKSKNSEKTAPGALQAPFP
jgi:hypothetical protein